MSRFYDNIGVQKHRFAQDLRQVPVTDFLAAQLTPSDHGIEAVKVQFSWILQCVRDGTPRR